MLSNVKFLIYHRWCLLLRTVLQPPNIHPFTLMDATLFECSSPVFAPLLLFGSYVLHRQAEIK